VFSKWLLSFRFPHPNCVPTSSISLSLIRTICSTHLIFLDVIAQRYSVRDTDRVLPHAICSSVNCKFLKHGIPICFNTLVNKTIIISDMLRHFLKSRLQADCVSRKEHKC
jgi:hypothetical protein